MIVVASIGGKVAVRQFAFKSGFSPRFNRDVDQLAI